MRARRLFFQLSLTCVSSFLISSCSPSKMTFKNGESWIPSEFNPRNTTLLVQKFEVAKSGQKKMEDYMVEAYPYKYRFITLKDLSNTAGRYTNTDSFRYVLEVESHVRQTQSTFNTMGPNKGFSSPGMNITGFDYHFYDRKLDKHYRQTGMGSGYAIMTFKPVINTIVANVQKQKKK